MFLLGVLSRKIISTGGEGGTVTTNDRKILEKIWSFKDHKSYNLANKKSNNNSFRWLHSGFRQISD